MKYMDVIVGSNRAVWKLVKVNELLVKPATARKSVTTSIKFMRVTIKQS